MRAGTAYAQIEIPAAGYVGLVAGTGTNGYSGDGGLAIDAKLGLPWGVAVDASGNIYIADIAVNRIRKVTALMGIITTIAGNTNPGYSGDGGLATSAELYSPAGVAVDANGNIYIADTGNNRIRAVYSSGTIPNVSNPTVGDIYTVAGNGAAGYSGDGGSATSARINYPGGVTVDGKGNIYIADTSNNCVRVVYSSGTIPNVSNPTVGDIYTVAGNGTAGYNGDAQPATSAELNEPWGAAVDTNGNIYIPDYWNYRVRVVYYSGSIPNISNPIVGDIYTVAGTGAVGYSGDGGAANEAQIAETTGVATDTIGDIYIADEIGGRIRMVTALAGTITTLAGGGTTAYSGGSEPATSVAIHPLGVTVDPGEDVYFANDSQVLVVGGNLVSSTFNPLYKVVSILYSPPGNQSAQGYGTSTTNGTTTTITSSLSDAQQLTFSAGIPGIISYSESMGTTQTTNQTNAFTQAFTNATMLTTTDNNNATLNPTSSNDINHNLDTLEIWLNPLVTVKSNGDTPVSYTVAPQPIIINGEPSPYAIVIGVPAIMMEATPAGVTALNPLGVAGITTIPVDWLVPQAFSQTSGNAYGPGLGAICANNTLYQQHLASNLAGNPNPGICTQANQCGCTPADFSGILQTDPLLNYDSTTYTANPYPGTESPLDADNLPTSSGPGSGPSTCELNTVPHTANCRYVIVPAPNTNTQQTANDPAVPLTAPLSVSQQSGTTYSDSTTTSETLGGSTSSSLGVSVQAGNSINVKVMDTWTWTDGESVGSSTSSANSLSVTLKTSTVGCSENASFYEDTLYHTYAFQVPSGNTACNPATFSISASPNGSTVLSLGHSVTYTVAVSPFDGFTGNVTLSYGSLPAGVTASWSTDTINTSGTASLTLSAAYSTSSYIGSSTVTVTGTSGSSAASTDFPLTTRPLQYKGYCGVN
jgi:hypothetical protein